MMINEKREMTNWEISNESSVRGFVIGFVLASIIWSLV